MLNTYSQQALTFAEDLINTFDRFLAQPEHLRAPADLERFARQRGMALNTVSDADLDAVRMLRGRLRAVWEAETTGDAIQQLDDLLDGIVLELTLTAAPDGTPLPLFDATPDHTVAQRIAAYAALGILGGIQQYGIERLRACAAEPCRDVFVDTSRNLSRRFCSERCANRHNIAAFRRRRRSHEDDKGD